MAGAGGRVTPVGPWVARGQDRGGGLPPEGPHGGVLGDRQVEDDTAAAMERQANRFAAELLMPATVCKAREEAFRRMYGVCPRTQFAYHLASELMVSPEAMRYRLSKRDLNLGVGDEQ